MPPTALLFDIDGTLVDTNGAGRRALRDAFAREFDLDDVAAKTASVHFAGSTDRRIFDELATALGVGKAYRERRAEFDRAYVRALRARMARSDPRRRALPGVVGLLEELSRREDTHLGLLTGNMRAGARIKLEPFGLNRFFATGGFGAESDDRRDIARAAELSVSRHAGVSFEPSRVVVIGDTPQDVDCARAHGFRAVAVRTGWASREALVASAPDALLADLSDREETLAAFGLDARRESRC